MSIYKYVAQAWILPALSNPERSSLYWSYSLLYCVPLLRNGFDIDGYVLAMLVLGILHVQVMCFHAVQNSKA